MSGRFISTKAYYNACILLVNTKVDFFLLLQEGVMNTYEVIKRLCEDRGITITNLEAELEKAPALSFVE